MKTTIMTIAIAAVVCCTASYAVQPAYEGQFGNPEEPALRVVKWPWLGITELVRNTHEGLKAGMEKESLCATGEKGACGAWKGTKTLVHHTAYGLIYAPLPEKDAETKAKSYEADAMAFIEAVTAKEQEGQEDSQAQEAANGSNAAEDVTPEEETEKYLNRKLPESDVEKAQRRYIPEKAAYRDRAYSGGGNLLKLAQ